MTHDHSQDGKEGKVSLEMLLDVQLTPRQRSFFKGAIQRDPAAIQRDTQGD